MLHYHANITLAEYLEPRAVIVVRRVSDTSVIGTPVVWSARVPLVRHTALTAAEWTAWHLTYLLDQLEV